MNTLSSGLDAWPLPRLAPATPQCASGRHVLNPARAARLVALALGGLTSLAQASGWMVGSGATLTVNGGIGGDIAVASGGTLSGGGAIGSLTLADGAVLAPNLASGFTVAGTLDLGGTLTLSLASPPAAGTVYTLIDNDDSNAAIGTFGGLNEGATYTVGATSFRLSYVGGDGNDVTLTVLAATSLPTDPGPSVLPTPTLVEAKPGSTTTLTGTTPVAASPGSTLIVPTGTAIEGTVITLTAPNDGSGAAPIVLRIGDLEVQLDDYQSGTMLGFKTVTVAGVATPVLVVTSGQVEVGAPAGQALVALNGSGAVLTAGAEDTSINLSMGDNGNGVFAVTAGYIVLPADAFAAGKRNARARAEFADRKVYAGELASFGSDGQINAVRLGSAPGESGGAGDALTLDLAVNLTFATTIPRLDATSARLGTSVQEALAQAAGAMLVGSQTNGVVTLDIGGDMHIHALPLGEVIIDGGQSDGVQLGADGTAMVASGGVVARFAASVADLGQLAQDVGGPFSWPSIEVTADGVLVASAAGVRYALRPGWTSTADDSVGFGEVNGQLVYGQLGRSYLLLPAVADWTKFAAAVDEALPGASMRTNADGTVTLTQSGQNLTLKPTPQLEDAPAGTQAWWAVPDGTLRLRNTDGTVQRFAPE